MAWQPSVLMSLSFFLFAVGFEFSENLPTMALVSGSLFICKNNFCLRVDWIGVVIFLFVETTGAGKRTKKSISTTRLIWKTERSAFVCKLKQMFTSMFSLRGFWDHLEQILNCIVNKRKTCLTAWMKGWETCQSSLVMCALKWRPHGIKLIWKISQFLEKTGWLIAIWSQVTLA